MVLAAAIALLSIAHPQRRVASEQQAIEIADRFRLFAILGTDGANVGEELKARLSCWYDETKLRFEVEYSDGFVWVRREDGRVSAFMLQDNRYADRAEPWELSERAIARAQAKVVRALAQLGYSDMSAVFGRVKPGRGHDPMYVSFRPVWRGIEYPGTEWRHAVFCAEGERLLQFSVTGLSRPPEDLSVTVEEADAERTMRSKLTEVHGNGPWERTRMKPVIFRVRPDKKPHIAEMHSWGWETGPPSVVAWEEAFVNPSVPHRPTDPPWTVHAWLDANTGKMLEMLSVRNRASSTWRPSSWCLNGVRTNQQPASRRLDFNRLIDIAQRNWV